MDIKTITEIHNRVMDISEDRFSQDTIAALLISLRTTADKQSLTREIGDFVAHPVRDRGQVLNHLASWNVQNIIEPGRTRIRIAIPAPKHGGILVDDMIDVLTALDVDASPLQLKREEILLCLFGILDSTSVTKPEKMDLRLKLSRNCCKNENGQEFLSIIAVSPNRLSHLYYSDILAEKYLQEQETDDFNFMSTYHVIRRNGELILQMTTIEPG